MPRICITVLFLILISVGLPYAETFPPTDGAVLDSLLSDAVLTGLGEFRVEPGSLERSARLDIADYLRPGVEAAVSGAGFFLADEKSSNDFRIAVTVSDIRRTIVRRGSTFDRHLSLTIHITCADRNGVIVLARRIEREYFDRVSRKQLEPTVFAGVFNGMLNPRVVIGPPGKLRIVSFAALAVALGVYAFRE